MNNPITLEQAEQITAQLPPREQLWLMARISERLSKLELAALVTTDEVAQPTEQISVEGCDWMSLRGIAPNLLEGQDAQAWVSHARNEADDQREQQWRRR